MIFQIKLLIKKIYKKLIIILFGILYSKPKLLKKKETDSSIQEYKISILKNNYKIFRLLNGSIYTDSNDTTSYISKNKFISEASMQYYKIDNINSFNGPLSSNETIRSGTPKFLKKIKGNVLSLLSGGASKDNFTHWFTDVIPRIKIFTKKFKLEKINKFYIPNLKYNYQKESLKYLGIKENQIITSIECKHLTADCIYATSHPCYHLPMKVQKWSLDYLNKIYSMKPYPKKFKKIFLDRDQVNLINFKNLKEYKNLRILINEKQIKDFLSSKGFDIIKPENFSFKEQVKIFSSAKIIIGLYGAAMMMLSFCKKNTKILEIKPILGGNEFKNISKLMGLNHKQINLKPMFKSSTPQNGLLNCPIEKIEKVLKNFGIN